MILENLYEFDRIQRAEMGSVICGVDEAGRGPLAGPVCCAAVVLAPEVRYDGLNDSKKITAKLREKLYDEIIASCAAYSVVMIDNETVDNINVLAATMLGMKQAVEQLKVHPAAALIDGNRAPDRLCGNIPCVTVVKGDAMSAAIAAASVIAKVVRDRYMLELHKEYPEYGFDKHKGYPTKLHYEAINEYGITPYHRKTFLKHGVKL